MSAEKPKILFIGGARTGLDLLKFLIDQGDTIVFAYISLEEESEKAKISLEIEKLCEENNINSSITRKITKDQVKEVIAHEADIAFVCGWRTAIPTEVYDNIPLGCIASHNSLLPQYRGFDPINWVVISGETETGVTLFKCVEGPADSGPIFDQKRITIGPDETALQIYIKVIEANTELFAEFLEALSTNSVSFKDQDETQATYTARRTVEDDEIDWNSSAQEIYNLIRGLSPPFSCARTTVQGKKILIVKGGLPEAMVSNDGFKPGDIVSILYDGMLVACTNGQVVINEVLKEDGTRILINSKTFKLPITLGG